MLDPETLDAIFWCGIINMMLLIISCYIVFYRFRAPIYHPIAIYTWYFLFGFCFRIFDIYAMGYSATWNYVGITPAVDSLIWSELLIVIAHLSMMAGFVATHHTGAVPPIPAFELKPARPLAFAVVACVFLLLAAYASSVQYGTGMDMDSVMTVSIEVDARGGQRLLNVSGYQTVFEELAPLTLVTMFAYRRTRKIAVALCLAFVAYRLMVGAGRQKFVSLGMALGIIVMIERRYRFPPLRFLAIGAVILILFNILGSDRQFFRKLLAGEETSSSELILVNRVKMDTSVTANMAEYDTFTVMASVIPERTGYSFGSQYLRIVIWPIPRFLWEDKPVFTTCFNINDYGNFNFMTSTLFIDSYMSLGTLSMISILFVVSLFLCRMYVMISKLKSALHFQIFVILMLFCPLLYRDGLVSACFYGLVSILGAFLICRLSGMTIAPRGQPSHAAPSSARRFS